MIRKGQGRTIWKGVPQCGGVGGDGKHFRNGVDLEPHLLVGRRMCTTVWREQDQPAGSLAPGRIRGEEFDGLISEEESVWPVEKGLGLVLENRKKRVSQG